MKTFRENALAFCSYIQSVYNKDGEVKIGFIISESYIIFF